MQVQKTIASFFSQIETQFQTQIKTMRTENVTETIQTECLALILDKGVVHQTSITGRPQQHGRVDRKHRHLLEVARP